MRKLIFRVSFLAAMLAALLGLTAVQKDYVPSASAEVMSAMAAGNCRENVRTNFSGVPADFMAKWNDLGSYDKSLYTYGYPVSDMCREVLEDGKEYEVMYFERARFERHPENAAPYNVLLGRFGLQILRGNNAGTCSQGQVNCANFDTSGFTPVANGNYSVSNRVPAVVRENNKNVEVFFYPRWVEFGQTIVVGPNFAGAGTQRDMWVRPGGSINQAGSATTLLAIQFANEHPDVVVWQQVEPTCAVDYLRALGLELRDMGGGNWFVRVRPGAPVYMGPIE